jgi:hypothetical protein
MEKKEKRDLVGHPSDYGSRTLADTADGEPAVERGTADSALTDDDTPENEEQ